MKEQPGEVIYAIVGATACGKSKLAHRMAMELKAEIISADSRAVYRGLNIGTAKPTPAERAELVYHMVDCVALNHHNFSLGEYLNLAQPILDSRTLSQIPIIVVGGTGFYLRGLLEGLKVDNVGADLLFRAEHAETPTGELHNMLIACVEEDISNRIHRNDRYRIIRALELHRAGVKPTRWRCLPSRKVRWIGILSPNRDEHLKRIQLRTRSMIERGLIQETADIVTEFGELEILNKTIGYKECLNHLKHAMGSIEELIELISAETLKYAKRQRIWFKQNKSIEWFSSDDDLLLQRCLERINS